MLFPPRSLFAFEIHAINTNAEPWLQAKRLSSAAKALFFVKIWDISQSEVMPLIPGLPVSH